MREDWWKEEERTTSKLFPYHKRTPWKRWLIIAGLCIIIIAGEVWIKGEVAAGKKDLSSIIANIFVVAGLAISLVQTIFAISSSKMSSWQKELIRHPRLVRTIDIVMVIICLLGIGTVSLLPYSLFQPGNTSAHIPVQEQSKTGKPERPTRGHGLTQQPMKPDTGASIPPSVFATQSIQTTRIVPSPTALSPVATPMAHPTPLLTVTPQLSPTPDPNKACRTRPIIWQARPGAYSTVPQVKKECLNRVIVGVSYLPAPVDVRYCPLSGEFFCRDWITFTQPESWQFIATDIPAQTSFYLQYKAHDPTVEPFGVVGWLAY